MKTFMHKRGHNPPKLPQTTERMVNNLINMGKTRQILRLHSPGRSKQEYLKYLKEFELSGLNFKEVNELKDMDMEDHFIKPEERPIKPKLHIVCGLFPGIDKELMRKCVTLLLLWEEYKIKNPDWSTKASSRITLASGNHSQSRMHIAYKDRYKLYLDFAGQKFVFLITVFKTKYIL